MVVWIPNFHLNTVHLNTRQLKVRYSDVSIIQMFVIQISTVFDYSKTEHVWMSDPLCKKLYAGGYEWRLGLIHSHFRADTMPNLSNSQKMQKNSRAIFAGFLIWCFIELVFRWHASSSQLLGYKKLWQENDCKDYKVSSLKSLYDCKDYTVSSLKFTLWLQRLYSKFIKIHLKKLLQESYYKNCQPLTNARCK